MDKRTDRHYQVHYLPASLSYAVNEKVMTEPLMPPALLYVSLTSRQGLFTVRKRNNLTTSVTLLDELPVSDLFFPN